MTRPPCGRLLWVAAVLLGHVASARADGRPAASEVGLEWNYRALQAASQGWMDAFRAQDEAALERVAARRDVDPVVLVGSLLGSHLSGSLADPPEPKDFLAAARLLAQRLGGRPAARALPGIVAAWAAFGRAELEREARVKRALSEVHDALSAGREPLALIEAALPDAARSPTSYRAGFLEVEHVSALRRAGRNADALAAAQRVIAHGRSLPWPYLESRGHLLAAADARVLGDLDAVVSHLEAARTLHEVLGEPEAVLLIEGKRALALREAARTSEALAGMDRVREQAGRAGRASLAASAAISYAGILAEAGRVPEALARGREVAAERLAAGDLVEAARAHALLGQIHSGRDRHGEALAAYEKALELAEAAPAPGLAAAAYNGLGIVWRKLRQPERAAEAYARAVAAAEAAEEPHTRAAALGNLGLVEAALARPGARETIRRALEAKRRLGDRLGALETVMALGSVLADSPGTRAEGRRQLEEAAAVLRRSRWPDRLAACLLSLARVALVEGDLDLTRRLAEEALAVEEPTGSAPRQAALAAELLAHVHLAQGRPREALARAREAQRQRRGMLAGLGDAEAASFVETSRAACDLGLSAALTLAAGGAPEEAAREAFDVLEAGRAALLTAGVVHGPALLAASVPEGLLSAEAAERARVEAARGALRAAATEPSPAPGAVEAARAALAAQAERHAAAVARLQRAAQRAAGVVWPEPVTAAELCPALDRHTAFVLYHLGPDRAAALVATCDGVVLVDLGPAAGLAEDVEGLARLLATPGSPEAGLAAAAYERLVRPLEAALGQRTRLLISPDGPLAFLPFEPLLRVDGERRQRLIERCEVAYEPSATSYLALRREGLRRTGRGLLALGDPAPGAGALALPPLPGAAEEVRAAAALYAGQPTTVLLGAEATLSRLTATLAAAPGRLAALHLACHAFIDPEQARLSSLVLAGGETLDVEAVYRQRIPADLAVLSACATAQGRLLKGEGVLGFARGFFVAGVPRVVVSDWVVDDAHAARLLTGLHRGLVREGLSPAASLRAAKLEGLRRADAGAHPSAWAAFVLWGLPE